MDPLGKTDGQPAGAQHGVARSSRWSLVPPAAIGAAAFLVLIGPGVLLPTNVGWLTQANPDSLTHYLGWAFFRASPWTLPLGANPAYGLELGSSIAYSDSIPLLALPFKLVSAWLPGSFQYTGPWLLACFLLQAIFAWKLAALAGAGGSQRLTGAALLVLSPPMLFRLHGHWALGGHWIILAALFLTLRPSRVRQAGCWILLSLAAALVHPYLAVMVQAVWFAAWLGDGWRRTRKPAALAIELVAVPACALLAMWQSGLFVVGEGRSVAGFGHYRMNLVAPVNPRGWSWLLPTLPVGPGDYEGFAYLGLGGLLAAAAALPAAVWLRRRRAVAWWPAHRPLLLAVFALTLLAITNNVGVGHLSFTYQVPERVTEAVAPLRASGRLAWPAFYVLMIAIIGLIVRACPPRAGAAVLTAALVVQAADLSAGWSVHSPLFRRRGATDSPLASAFWNEAPSSYRAVRLVPFKNYAKNWEVFAQYAARTGMATDAVYLARIDSDRAKRVAEETTGRLLDGTRDPTSLFILQDGTERWVACAMVPGQDQLAWVDGFWVLMPDWRSRHGDWYAGPRRLACPVLSADGPPLMFVSGASDSAAVMVEGWSSPEEGATWSEGRRSTLVFRLGGPVSALDFTVAAAARPGPPLDVEVYVNGGLHATWRLPPPGWRVQRVTLPPGAAGAGKVTLAFAYSDIRSPAEVGAGADPRQLAMALYEVRAVR